MQRPLGQWGRRPLNAPQGTKLSLHEADKASNSEWRNFSAVSSKRLKTPTTTVS